MEFSFINNDYYLVKKKIIKTIPFVLNSGLKIIDNNYYIVEILPKNENYAIRVYLDSEKNVIEYYIDITNGCGIDIDSKIPYYDDLYLDITITKDEIEVLDEDELFSLYDGNKIRDRLFDDDEDRNIVIQGFNKYLKDEDSYNRLKSIIKK